MGADYYQTESEIASLLAEGKVPVGVGENTKIRYDYVTQKTILIRIEIPLSGFQIRSSSNSP